MGKSHAFKSAAVCGGLWLLSWLIHAGTCAWIFFFLTCIFGCIWYVYFNRDEQLAETYRNAPDPLDTQPHLPARTSPGSEQLFVTRASSDK